MQNGIDSNARHPTSYHVDGVMGLNINGGKTHEYEQRQQDIEQYSVTTAPCQYHQDRGHTDMTAGEGRCRLFARFVGTGHALVEKAVAITWYGECFVVGGEVIAYIGEVAVGNVIKTYSQIIVLWTCDGQEDEDDVKDEERREDNECRTVELLVTAEEVEQRDDGYHREIRCIAQVHQFAEHRV